MSEDVSETYLGKILAWSILSRYIHIMGELTCSASLTLTVWEELAGDV